MDWEKASPELSDLPAQAVEPFALVERRKMFGGLSLFINGHMFAGVYGNNIALKLGEDDGAKAQTEAGAMPFEPMPGRVMKEYVVLPEARPRVSGRQGARRFPLLSSYPPRSYRLRLRVRRQRLLRSGGLGAGGQREGDPLRRW